MRRGMYLLAVCALFTACTLFMFNRSPSGGLYQELGWRISLPGGWVAEAGRLRDLSSAKVVQFYSKETTQTDLASWLTEEVNKTALGQPVIAAQQNGLKLYSFSSIDNLGKQFTGPRYTGQGYAAAGFKTVYLEDKLAAAHTAVFFDGIKQYVFSSNGVVSSAEFKTLVDSFRVLPVREALAAERVKELCVFVPGANTKVLTRKADKLFIDRFVAAYNSAAIYRSDVGKAYPVVVTLTLQDGSQIEISGGSFDFQTIRVKEREFNVRGVELQKFFTIDSD
jgi:hypothetical protein